ncbi:DUF7507 domain-containing protein [Paenibacillus sp. MMS18-CY102]|uniref:DUF7507 domain-containing protein n=1 Tax=Paenibacillus sp. MMS18-CY102 TaxID=2682849 RepID=UPI0013657D62|nr:DUF11 domain-containing protein [Paenibacillus sp. MMS18-CY102]MWC30359.1 DUF11 domain-containing protein [Paenibacillus sp. MMS18-CY102]
MEPCPFQGPGKQNPAFIGGYDNPRPTNDPSDPNYWIGSGESVLFDAAANGGTGGEVIINDLIRISKQATLESSEECDCIATVTVDIEAKPAAFQYFPPTPLDVVFVLDVTSSMMKDASMKFVQAKRALINTINQLWAANRNTTVTIVPYGRDAFVPVPSPATGFGYDYVGTLFQWKRSSAPPASFPSSTYYIGQILGYRNQSNVSTTVLTDFVTQTTPRAASAVQSLYNFYNYYKITYSDIYDASGNPLPDNVLSTYITNVYNAQPSAYTSNQIVKVAANAPLTAIELQYSMDEDGYANNSILQNLVWAVPYSEDTDTEAGLQAAYNLFKTPGFAQSEDIFRRVVILITDGQANRSINPAFPATYVQPGDTDATFFPDVPGEPWKYFTYLLQTQAQLVREITSRSSTFDEIILASTRAQSISDQLKNPLDGNTQLYALGIDIEAQSPGPYTRDDVLNLMKSWVSAPSYFREAITTDPDAINTLLAQLVNDVLSLYAGCKLVLQDVINNALFSYVPGSIQIRGVRDGLKLRSPNQPIIIDPADPDFTVYPKAPLLPDVSDATVVNGTIAIDFGTMPLGMLSAGSLTTATLTYQVESNPFANGNHLHTNTDNQTFISFIEPSHLVSSLSVIDYSAPPKQLFFQTPIVACTCTPVPGLTLLKVVDRSAAAPLDTVNYSIQLTNTGTLALTDITVNDPTLGIRFVVPILNPLETSVNTFPFTIPAGTPAGPFNNTATATNSNFPEPLTSTATVNISLTPSLLFSKTVNKRVAAPGETVIFTLTAVNNGNVDLVNVRVTDALLGISTTIARIAVGATITSDFPYVIPADAPIDSVILNTATTVADNLPPITVGASVVVAAVPRLQIEKTPDQTEVPPGTIVNFTIAVTNNGSTPLTNIAVNDPVIGLSTVLPILQPGETTTIIFPSLIPLETTAKVYTNTVTAISDPPPGSSTVPTAQDNAQVQVVTKPAIGVRKIPNRTTVPPGGIIEYEISIANFGNIPLSPTRIVDPLLGVDLLTPGLAVGEIHTATVTYQVPADALIGSVIDNVLTAISPEAGEVQVEAIVTVVGSGLALSKSTDLRVAMPGDIVLYTISVTNLLTVPQTNVVLSDPFLGLNEIIPVLAAGATESRTIPFSVPSSADGTVIRNVATVLSDQTPVQQTEALLAVQSELSFAALEVTKTADRNFVSPGASVIYSVSVTNTGPSAATNIAATDDLTGTTIIIPSLVPGERKIVTFTYKVPEGTVQGTAIHNVVTATSPQSDPRTAEETIFVALPQFFLQLTNVVDKPVVPPGTLVHFTITVTNIGPFTLHQVRVVDNLTGLSVTLPELAPSESRAFVRPYQVSSAAVAGQSFTDIATAFSNETPFEQAPATTVVITIADFTIGKTVDRPVVTGGETVFFTIRVQNVGNVDLVDFTLEDALLGVSVLTKRFRIGSIITIRVPFVTPEVEDDTIIVNTATGRADAAGPKAAEASVLVLPEDEE